MAKKKRASSRELIDAKRGGERYVRRGAAGNSGKAINSRARSRAIAGRNPRGRPSAVRATAATAEAVAIRSRYS